MRTSLRSISNHKFKNSWPAPCGRKTPAAHNNTPATRLFQGEPSVLISRCLADRNVTGCTQLEYIGTCLAVINQNQGRNKQCREEKRPNTRGSRNGRPSTSR